MAQLDSFMDNVGATVKFAAVKAFLLNPKLLGHIARDAIGKARAVEGKNRAAKRKTLAGGRKAQIQWRIKAAEWSRKNSAMACQDVLERLSVSGYIDIQDDKVLVNDGPDGEKKAFLLSGFKKSLSSVMSKSRKNT